MSYQVITRGKRKAADYGVKRIAKSIGSYAASQSLKQIGKYALRRFSGRSSGANRRGRGTYTKSLGGPRAKFRGRKSKPISNAMKGVSKKFASKVQKVINHSDAWGEYIYHSDQRLRQDTRDRFGVTGTDSRGHTITMGTVLDVRDAASVLYLGKAAASSFFTTAGNFDKGVPIKLLRGKIEMFFKSTSSHVVNIEVFECTVKDQTGSSPSALAYQTSNNYTFKYHNDGAAEVNADPTYIGTKVRHFTELQKSYKIKTHTVKLQPGGYSSLSFNVAYNKLYDGSQHIDIGATDIYTKGAKVFMFRMLNDATVSSQGAGVAGIIHHWPSNPNGGVAMRYTKTYRVAPPTADYNSGFTKDTRNIVKIFGGLNTDTTSGDQQVTMNNPPDTGTED